MALPRHDPKTHPSRRLMLPLRAALGYVLWRIGLKPILPRQIINRVRIADCGEPLAPVVTSSKLLVRPVFGTKIFLRESALQRLNAAAQSLPDGIRLVLVEGHRSLARQKELWDRQFAIVQTKHPHATLDEIERLTRLTVAKPASLGGGHQTGGAVDVTLADSNGNELDMGTRVHEFSPHTPSFTQLLPPTVSERRQLLLTTMRNAGFSNFPGEWWHFSHGDQMWAANLTPSMARSSKTPSLCFAVVFATCCKST